VKEGHHLHFNGERQFEDEISQYQSSGGPGNDPRQRLYGQYAYTVILPSRWDVDLAIATKLNGMYIADFCREAEVPNVRRKVIDEIRKRRAKKIDEIDTDIFLAFNQPRPQKRTQPDGCTIQ
jgi:hypothetical protein